MDATSSQQSPFNPQLLLERLRMQQAGRSQPKRANGGPASPEEKQKMAPSSSSSLTPGYGDSSAANNSNKSNDSYAWQPQQQKPYVNPFRQKFDFEAPSIYGSQSDYSNNDSQNDAFYDVFRNLSQNLSGDTSKSPFTAVGTLVGASVSKASAATEADNSGATGSASTSLFNERDSQYDESIEELNTKLQHKVLELSEDLRLSNQKNIELQIENETLEFKFMQLKFKTDDTIADLRGKVASYALGKVPVNTGNSKVFAESGSDSAAYLPSYSDRDNSLNGSSYSEPTFSEIMRRTARKEFVGDDYFNTILRKSAAKAASRSPGGNRGGRAGAASPAHTLTSLNDSTGSDRHSQSRNPPGGNAGVGEAAGRSDVTIDIYPSLKLNESIVQVANSTGIKDKRMSVWSSDRRKSLNSWLTDEYEVVVDVDLTTELDN